MDYRAITDNAPVLMAITPAMLGVFSLAWTVLRKSWRVFGFGLLIFVIPFSCFLMAEAMAVVELPAAVFCFLAGCVTLGLAVIGFGSFLVFLWRSKENDKNGDFVLIEPPNRATKVENGKTSNDHQFMFDFDGDGNVSVLIDDRPKIIDEPCPYFDGYTERDCPDCLACLNATSDRSS